MDGLSLIAEKIISDLLPMAGDKVMERERYATELHVQGIYEPCFVFDINGVVYT